MHPHQDVQNLKRMLLKNKEKHTIMGFREEEAVKSKVNNLNQLSSNRKITKFCTQFTRNRLNLNKLRIPEQDKLLQTSPLSNFTPANRYAHPPPTSTPLSFGEFQYRLELIRDSNQVNQAISIEAKRPEEKKEVRMEITIGLNKKKKERKSNCVSPPFQLLSKDRKWKKER